MAALWLLTGSQEGTVPYLESEPNSWGFPAIGPGSVL